MGSWAKIFQKRIGVLLDISEGAVVLVSKYESDRTAGSSRHPARRLFWTISPVLIVVISITAIATGTGDTPKAGWIGVGIGVFGIAVRIWIYALIKRSPSKEARDEPRSDATPSDG